MATFPVFYHHGTLEQTPYIEELTSALDPTVKTELEAGYVATRAKFTRAPRRWALRFDKMSSANKATLRAFEVARGIGAGSFTWADPEYVPVNLLANPGFETGTLENWSAWGTPETSEIAGAAHAHSGNYCLYHVEDTAINSGRVQTIPCVAGMTYTFTVWAYQLVGSTAIGMLSYDGTTYPTALLTEDYTYQQLSLSVTPGTGQTTLSMWLGGLGAAWFDDAFISTPSTTVRFASPIIYTPVENTNNTRWNISFTLEEV